MLTNMPETQEDSIFTKIIKREAAAEILFEDDEMIAINDIRPKAPVHVLIISKEQIPSLNECTEQHVELLGRMMLRAKAIAAEKGIAATGYKVVNNVGEDGGQIIKHFHLHLLGGEPVKTLV